MNFFQYITDLELDSLSRLTLKGKRGILLSKPTVAVRTTVPTATIQNR